VENIILEPAIFIITLIGLIASLIILFYLTTNSRNADIFKTIVIHSFFFIISGVAIFPLDRLHPSQLGYHDNNFLSVAFLLIVYAATVFLLRGRIHLIFNNLFKLFQQQFLGIYIGLLVFSFFWSDNPFISLRASIGLLFISTFTVYFGKEYKWEELFKLLRWNGTLIAGASIFTALLFPSTGIAEKGWQGVLGHPIDLGNLMAFNASLWLMNGLQSSKYRVRSLVFCTLSLIVMQLANSAGAFIVFLALIVIIFLVPLLRKLNFFQAYILFLFILLILAIPSIWLISNFEHTLSLLNKDVTFTGRIPLWHLLLDTSIKQRPWFGYGYSGFWQSWQVSDSPAAPIVRTVGDWAVHAHNGFLDIILSVGLIGFIIFILSFLTNLSRAIKLILCDRDSELILPLVILTFIFMTNLSHSPIMIPSYIWFLYVLVTVRLQIDLTKDSQKYNFRYLAKI
jgi:O-antigen ligase